MWKLVLSLALLLLLVGCSAHEKNVHIYDLAAAGAYNPFITARAGGFLVGVDGNWKGDEVKYEKTLDSGATILVHIKGSSEVE